MARGMPPTEEDLAKRLQRGRHLRGLLLLGGWGAAAVFSLGVAAVVAQTSGHRLKQAMAASQPVRPVAKPAIDPTSAAKLAEAERRAARDEAKMERLAARVRALSADRDRLTKRLAGLEHQFDSITGSINRQTAAAAKPSAPTAAAAPPGKPAKSAEAPAPGVPAGPATAASNIAPPSAPASLMRVPAMQLAAIHAPPSVGFMPSPQIATPLTMSLATATKEPTGKTPEHAVTQTKSTDAAAPSATVEMAQKVALAEVPLPPKRTAAHQPLRPEIGVDLGKAETLDTVRAQWAAVKANFGTLLTGLHPVAVRESRPGSGPYRLVIGTLPSRAAAARLCAHFAVGRVYCRPVEFAGRQLVQR